MLLVLSFYAFIVDFVARVAMFGYKKGLFLNPEIANLSTNPFFIIASGTFRVNLLKSDVENFLLWISSTFVSRLLTLGILFLTTANTEVVAKPKILSILPSISVTLAL